MGRAVAVGGRLHERGVAVSGHAMRQCRSGAPAAVDRGGGGPLLRASGGAFRLIKKVVADSGYAGARVATCAVIVGETVRNNPDQVGFAIQPRR